MDGYVLTDIIILGINTWRDFTTFCVFHAVLNFIYIIQ